MKIKCTMKQSQMDWSRRKFIHTLAGSVAVIMLNPLSSWTVDQGDPVDAGGGNFCSVFDAATMGH